MCIRDSLKTNHVRFSFGQPSQEVVKPLIDVVNVEGSDSHQVPFCPCTSGCAPQRSHRIRCFRLASFYRWKELENHEPKRMAYSSSGGLRSPKWLGSGATTEMPLPVTRKEVAARPFARSLESCSDRRQPVGNAHSDQSPLFLAASRQCPSIPRRKKEGNLAYDCA